MERWRNERRAGGGEAVEGKWRQKQKGNEKTERKGDGGN